MRNLKIIPIFLTIAVLLTLCTGLGASALENPNISANAVVLLDMSTGHVLYAKNEHNRVYPASLTKIMTVLVTLEAISAGKVSADDYVTASQNIGFDLTDDGSTADIVPGETMTLKNLLYCTLVTSANEACNIIAEHVGGTIPDFVQMMNDKAQQLGCTGTHFANTHGLPNGDHYTTAWDFTLISRAAADYGLFMEICNTRQVEIPPTNLKTTPRILKNTNALLGDNDYYAGYTYDYARGIKTGYTSAAGYCLISTAINGDYNLMAVVMGSRTIQQADGSYRVGSFDDSIALYEWTFANWSYIEVLKTSKIITDIPLEMGRGADRVSVRPAQPIFALLPHDVDTGIFEESVVIFSERNGVALKAPISVGEVLGEISILRNGEIIGRTSLVATSSIELSKTYYIRSEIKRVLESSAARVLMIALILMFVLYTVSVIRYRSRRRLHLRSLRQARSERAKNRNGNPEPAGPDNAELRISSYIEQKREPGAPPDETGDEHSDLETGDSWELFDSEDGDNL